MAGKPLVLVSRPMAYAVDVISKNTLAELVIDRIRIEIGEDASEESIASTLEQWLSPVCRERGDKVPPVSARLRQVYAAIDEYRQRNGLT